MYTKSGFNDMTPSFRVTISVLLPVLLVVLFSGCTAVRVKTDTAEVTVVDIRVTGSAIDLEGVLNDVGSISVNREQGSALQDAAPIIEQLNPTPKFDFTPSI